MVQRYIFLITLPRGLLSRKDSNLDKQNQNLLCYHYTTRQPNHSPTPVEAENAVQR